jgi:hypothetical protein
MSNDLARLATPQDRIHQVSVWILEGNSEHEIQQTISTLWPDAKARPLIVQAMQGIAKNADADADVVRGWAIEATRTVYKKALESNDFSAALRALKQITDLSKNNV